MLAKMQRPMMRRVGVLFAAAAIALSATGCFANVSSSPPVDIVDNAIYQAMNHDRQVNGVAPLRWSPKLGNTAFQWAYHEATVNSMYHQDLTALLYSSDYNGWYTLGENLLVGPTNMPISSMEQAWMNSYGHRANILNGSFNAVGVAHVWGPDGRIWVVVDFGGL
jgi:uncharacterized protein YkwD